MSDNNLDNIELRSEEVQEILTAVPNWMIRWGSALFLILILMLLAISWFVKYPDIILSEATITTQVPPQKEFAKTTGKLEAVLVEDNQVVRANQPMAIIENTADYTDVFKLKSTVDSIRITNDSFEFPFKDLPILSLGDIESQFALFENSYIQYQLNKRLRPFTNEAVASKYSIAELKRRINNLQHQKKINRRELSFKEKELKRYKSLFDSGVISAQEYENKQLAHAQAERNYQTFESSISQLRETLSGAHKTSKGIEINKVKEEMVLLKSVIQSFNQLKKAIKDWENIYVLQSNIDGKVSFLNFWNRNQTVSQGDLVFTVIPSENSSYVAKLKTPAQNSGKLKKGQKVNIRLVNYPDTEFGVLRGHVKGISLIADKEGLYYLDADLPDKLITSYKKEIEFKHEMKGSAEIITEDLRLLERFFYQFKEMFKR
ncbi:MAG: HlyD family secretion protein [Saprospiraceae bacterium]